MLQFENFDGRVVVLGSVAPALQKFFVAQVAALPGVAAAWVSGGWSGAVWGSVVVLTPPG